jgi:hypothetical protein
MNRPVSPLFFLTLAALACGGASPYPPPPGRPIYRIASADQPIEEIDLAKLTAQVQTLQQTAPPPPAGSVDPLARALAKAAGHKDARTFIADALTVQAWDEAWLDNAPYRFGFSADLSNPDLRAMQDGRFVTYHSDARQRSLRIDASPALAAALALQKLEASPLAHEDHRRKVAPNDPVVHIVDASPPLDGKPEASYCEVSGHVLLAADPKSLFIFIDKPRDKGVTLKIYDCPEPTPGEHFAHLQILPTQSATTNNRGQTLTVYPKYHGDGTELQIPWSMHKGQVEWMNGFEHARGRIEINIEDGEKMTRPFYILSTPERMKARLLTIVESTIIQHAQLIAKTGRLPASVNEKGEPSAEPADAAQCADLLAAIAEYRRYLKK